MGKRWAAPSTIVRRTIGHAAHDAAGGRRRVGRPAQGPYVAVGADLQVHPVLGRVGLRRSRQDVLRLRAAANRLLPELAQWTTASTKAVHACCHVAMSCRQCAGQQQPKSSRHMMMLATG